MDNQRKKLGIIQSRGLGDIIISLPIARFYYDQGYDVFWPICQEFFPSMESAASWVYWIPMPTDRAGEFFYSTPMAALEEMGCEEIIPLYNALSQHPEFSQEPYFQHTKFDQYKYIRAGVPFLHKWRLQECITRNTQREQDLYKKLVKQSDYVVVHLDGSDYRAEFDRKIIPKNWQTIEIKPQTDNIFDWLTILEKAQSLILVDSVYANLVDQLNIGTDRYFLPRSHIQLTPTLGQDWTWLLNTRLPKNTEIFRPG